MNVIGALVVVANAEEDRTRCRQRLAGAQVGLGQRPAEVAVAAHDLAGGLHLGPEHRVLAGEPGERQHRLLDADELGSGVSAGAMSASRSPAMTRAASRASGMPIALLTNGTVREARGLASST